MLGTGLFTSSFAIFYALNPLGDFLSDFIAMVSVGLGLFVLSSFIITRVLKLLIRPQL